MQRPRFRSPHPAAGSRSGGFRTPSPALDRAGVGRFPSPAWSHPNSPYTPRFGSYGGSPVRHTSHRDYSSNRGCGSGIYNAKSPGHTPRRPTDSPVSRHSPYQSPGPHCRYQGSPRTSTPYGRDRGTDDMDKYYKASMLQDPWANLQPVSVTQTQLKYPAQQATHSGRAGRYYNKNSTI